MEQRLPWGSRRRTAALTSAALKPKLVGSWRCVGRSAHAVIDGPILLLLWLSLKIATPSYLLAGSPIVDASESNLPSALTPIPTPSFSPHLHPTRASPPHGFSPIFLFADILTSVLFITVYTITSPINETLSNRFQKEFCSCGRFLKAFLVPAIVGTHFPPPPLAPPHRCRTSAQWTTPLPPTGP